MSIDVNHFPEKKIRLRYGIAFGGLRSRSPEGGGEEAHQMRRPVERPHFAASFSASSSLGLLFFKIRIGLLLLQSKC